MGNRQWAMGNGEEKRRPPPSAKTQTPPPSGRGRSKKEDEREMGEKSGGQGALTPALSPREREEESREDKEEEFGERRGEKREKGRGVEGESMVVSMGLAASSRVESEIGWWGRVGNMPFLLVIRVYRVVLSPVVGGQCRFEPTCSRYAAEAYRLYGPMTGTKMAAGRICRCHPWNAGGFDPVRIPGDDGLGPDEGDQEGDADGSTAGGTEA